MKIIISLLFAVLAIAVQAKPNPNVVIFVLDDVAQRDISIYGHGAPPTPRIDQLAQEGVYFDRAWVATSSCSPSRASMLTGRYPSQTGAPNLDDPLPAAQTTIASELGKHGYYTAALGKWHLGEEVIAHFDKVEDAGDATGSANWRTTLLQRPPEKPFFFWLGMRDAHDPFDAWHAPLRRLTINSAAMRPWLVGLTRETMEHRDYFHEVARADRVIGEFVDLLAEQQLLDNTIVIVISDNGPVQRAKTTLYERGLLTPLIVRYPPVTHPVRGERIHSLVSSIDLAPSIFQLVGVPTPKTVQGVAIPALSDGRVERQWLYAERHNHAGEAYERALRTETHLYKRNFLNQPVCSPLPYVVRSIAPKTETYGAEELYELASDPHQRNNVLHDETQAEVLAKLRATMSWQLRLLNDNGPPLNFIRCEQYRSISLLDAYRDIQ